MIKLAQIEYVGITDFYIIASICLKVNQEGEEDTGHNNLIPLSFIPHIG